VLYTVEAVHKNVCSALTTIKKSTFDTLSIVGANFSLLVTIVREFWLRSTIVYFYDDVELMTENRRMLNQSY